MSAANTVILIEDDPQIRRFIKESLQREGWKVFESDTGQRGLIEAGSRKPDLLLVDLGLPDMDGVEVVRDFRNWSAVPILILSARSNEHEKIIALDAGADDYLTKPFGIGELLARVRAVTRRRLSGSDHSPKFNFGDVEVDFSKHTVTKSGNFSTSHAN